MRLGIVGAGGAATLVGAALRDTVDVQLSACAAVTRETAERYAREYGARRAYEGFEALLDDDDVEAVYLATPNALHHRQALTALAAGKHVLVEKPMALGRREAQELATAAAGSALVLGVGFHLRHSDVFRELKRLILAGAVGDPRFVRAAWGMPLPELSGWKQDRAQAGAGALMGLAVHLLDLVLWLVDAPVGAVTAMSDAHEERLDRNYVIAFEIGGCMVEISVSRSFALGASLVLFGTDGALWAEDAVTVRAEGTLRDGGGAVLVKAASNPYAVELRTFADAASGGPRFHADASDGLRCVELTDAVLAATAAA